MQTKFNSAICTSREQSERLLSLGLKKETADICLRPDNTIIPIHENCFVYHSLENAIQVGYCPAWSLHRLISLSPEKIPYASGYLTTDIINNNVYVLLVLDQDEQRCIRYTKGNLYDNLISCIEFYIKEGYFNKEYLE